MFSVNTVDIHPSIRQDKFTIDQTLNTAGIQHGHVCNQWQELASTAMNYRLPQNERNLLFRYLPGYEN
jgi:hypothetical protein